MWKFIILATFSVIWAIAASGEFFNEELGKKKDGDCNTTITDKNSTGFHSGAFNKTTGVYCFWNFTSYKESPITVFFFYLYLHEDDKVDIYKSVNGTRVSLAPTVKANNGSMAVITGEGSVFMELKGSDTNFIRHFEGVFSDDCSVAVPPDVKIIYSPTYATDISSSTNCIYRFNDVQHDRVIQVLTFEKFNMSQSTVHIEGGTFSGDYKYDSPVDIFNMADGKPLMLTVNMQPNTTDYFKLNAQEVDKICSGYKLLENNVPPPPLKSPPAVLNNGSIVYECRWMFEHKDVSKILGLQFGELGFSSIFDIVAVNDGPSELSTPLLQVTTSNRNTSQNQVIRTSGPFLWISFKPVDYSSSFNANITIHGQGGYFRNNGTIEMKTTVGNDTIFLLEVEKGKNVLLTFDDSTFSLPAALYVYDDFDQRNLLTSLHGQIKFPILSRSSRMMIIGKEFGSPSSHFSAKFKGITPGCNHMSSLNTENYILSENCNTSCMWVIPPQDSSNSVLLLNLQYISLNEGDELTIHQLDDKLSQLGLVTANQSHVPHIAVSANVGLLVNVTQGSCKEKTDKIVLIGHSSYMPGCSTTVKLKPSEKYQISSPLYPDTYPLFASCQWNISVQAGSFIHMTFENLKLAENHCVKISHNSSKKYEYNGKILPKDDLFLTGDTIVEFDSTNCSKPRVGQMLNSDEGFLLNITATDCGAVFDGKKSGEFNTSISRNKSICIWKVSVPPADGGSVNIISYTMTKKDKSENYTMTKKDKSENYELKVYDGSSVRDLQIINDTGSDVWSRTNSLIFVYMRLNISQPSSELVFKYSTISCNSSMQCQNKVCMHPDWKCNGVDECGDNSDERNCASVPIPPEVKFTGYSATAFWLCVLAMMLIGVILGVTVPICYQKYKDSRYTRFRELSGIDG